MTSTKAAKLFAKSLSLNLLTFIGESRCHSLSIYFALVDYLSVMGLLICRSAVGNATFGYTALESWLGGSLQIDTDYQEGGGMDEAYPRPISFLIQSNICNQKVYDPLE